MKNIELTNKAHDIYNYVESCVSNLAEAAEVRPDDVWNNSFYIYSTMAAEVYFSCNGFVTEEDELVAMCILDELDKIGHKAFRDAVNELREFRKW